MRRTPPSFVASLLLAAVALAAPAGRAQTAAEPASFPVERLRPALDRDGVIDVEWARVGPHLTYDAALWVNYALNPLVVTRSVPGAFPERVGVLVGHRVGASLVGGISLFDWVQLGAELPVILFQSRGPGVPSTEAVVGQLNAIGVGDLRLAPKIRILRSEEAFVDVAVMPAFTLPTNFPRASYFGEGDWPTFVPELLVSKDLLGLRLAGNLGARLRPETRFLSLNVTHELTWRAGLGYRFADVLKVPLEIDASLSGATAALAPFSSIDQNPIELLAGATYEVWPGWMQVFGGAGVGILAGFGTPDLRLFAGVRFSPRVYDKDGDGILDDDDACPEQAEDKDGFDDADGCPDPDNDGDGILDVDDKCPTTAGVPERQGCPLDDADGDGVRDADDKCPNEAEDKDEFQDEDGCPDLDDDGDGIKDADDKCPRVAEDKDGYEDQDGCPEPDNDDDGILDASDQCPEQPEDMDGDRDEDGCPDEVKIVVTRKKVFALEKIYFDTGKTTIQRASFGTLDEVARVLKENPEIPKVRIEGHTDAQGPDDFNLKLSQGRAEAVKRYLEKAGIPEARLEAIGFGETKPIGDNETPEGREKNRRVEFLILDEAGAPR
jgi:outer membrane protein OmpA-like peptidoglycan-associated protein